MVQGTNYTLDVFLNDQDLQLDTTFFRNFMIFETIHFGIYYGILMLGNVTTLFKEVPLISGLRLKIKILFENEKTSREYKFVIYEIKNQIDVIKLILIPEVGIKLIKDETIKGYNDKVDNIIRTIGTAAGILNFDIESTTLPASKFLCLSKTPFSFMKYLVKRASNGVANYIFFIDKTDKLKFYSIKYLKSKKEVAVISDQFCDEIEIDDSTVALQFKSGFGGRGIYFDWDTGAIKEKVIGKSEIQLMALDLNNRLSDKFGILSEYINKNNNIMMLNPTMLNSYFDDQYNKAELENELIRKNYFNVFLNLKTFANLDISAGEQLYLHMRGTSESGAAPYTGKWIVYEAIHIFTLSESVVNVKLTNSFVYKNLSANII